MTQPTLTTRAMKRLAKDLKNLIKEPLVGANAQPRDEDLSLWDATIKCPLSHPQRGEIFVPLHFLIEFPPDYPASAPSVGFSVKFPYHTGASYVINDPDKGRLNGHFVLCLDLLGNFAHVHTEWTEAEGSGWSPAYTVTTLLVQLQSLIIGINADLSQGERKTLFELCSKFADEHPDRIVRTLTEIEMRERKEEKKKNVSSMEELQKLANEIGTEWTQFATKANLTQNLGAMRRLAVLVADTKRQAAQHVFAACQKAAFDCGIQVSASATDTKSEEGGESKTAGVATVAVLEDEPEIDENICCYVTGASYVDGILGYGISEVRKGRSVVRKKYLVLAYYHLLPFSVCLGILFFFVEPDLSLTHTLFLFSFFFFLFFFFFFFFSIFSLFQISSSFVFALFVKYFYTKNKICVTFLFFFFLKIF